MSTTDHPHRRLLRDPRGISSLTDPPLRAPCATDSTFAGQLQSDVRCGACGEITSAFDPVLDISLDLKSKAGIIAEGENTLVKSLRRSVSDVGPVKSPVSRPPLTSSGCFRYTSPEKLGQSYLCDKCGTSSLVRLRVPTSTFDDAAANDRPPQSPAGCDKAAFSAQAPSSALHPAQGPSSLTLSVLAPSALISVPASLVPAFRALVHILSINQDRYPIQVPVQDRPHPVHYCGRACSSGGSGAARRRRRGRGHLGPVRGGQAYGAAQQRSLSVSI